MDFLKSCINKKFKNDEPWKIVLKTVVASGALYGAGCLASEIRENGLGETVLAIAKKTPIIKDIIEKELAKVKSKAEEMALTSKEVLEYKVNSELPSKGVSREVLMKDLTKWEEIERSKYSRGQTSGTVYHGDRSLADFAGDVMKMFCLANPLHPSTFPFVQKMEAEVVAMTLKMFQGTSKDHCGLTTSGGTESILMAMKAYREKGYAKGIRRPEIVACVTVHAAFDKAADYFGMKLVHVPFDRRTYQADISAIKNAVTRSTVVIVCSAPCYAQGIIDPVEEVASFIEENDLDVGLHVDCCLGGFLAPFVRIMDERKGLPKFDFSVKQVTSISADTHKYGYSPKGTSVLMYASRELRRMQYFTAPRWTGGIYATPSAAGSRPGAVIAATWAVMMHMGLEGYMDASRKIMQTADTIKKGIGGIEGLEVMGDPQLSVIGIRSTNPDLNIYALAYSMGHDKGREWELNSLQNPSCVHICCTYMHKGLGPKFVDDLRGSVKDVLENKAYYAKKSSVAIYGTTKSAPGSLVGETSKAFIDALFKLPKVKPEESKS
uniref:sphinganine-1-phosphate aldolase n=1 Tax=Lotharella globosa TaxID=91324 RepID=A0A7S3YKK9_9EUKA|mmetsp:Transcript_1293/g.2469  ORF Transcript_1293/g.2469 Transcript_1293/m.2469 type:complete len:550 (-) Transcript_1293:180-1829(-)|eukprot:CAMPEP_0167788688 /NCGR_PEP_ID=MMETSP0111_2-20121227/10189_1 /TAXON_ID=91324 /ORGANISM="Lotharella globosa, Strain CCCM811" /LENGTH=549 /DNA_ID=CAMNT_0007680613 /DNA_START=55 /DNA_END=1704 /DNA_ORIENTATION=+